MMRTDDRDPATSHDERASNPTMIHQTKVFFQLGFQTQAGFPVRYQPEYTTKTDALEAKGAARLDPNTKLFRVTEIIEEVEG